MTLFIHCFFPLGVKLEILVAHQLTHGRETCPSRTEEVSATNNGFLAIENKYVTVT